MSARSSHGNITGSRAKHIGGDHTTSPSMKYNVALALLLLSFSAQAAESGRIALPLADWRIVKRDSGPTNYYSLHKEKPFPFIRARYRPTFETAVLGYQLPDQERSRARWLSWKWRAITLPVGGNECASGKEDSAAVVYVSWRRALRWYAVKYVWSAVGPKGAICDRKRNPFMAQDTVIMETGTPIGVWRDETIDLDAEFRKHFADGDPSASVPDFMGVGIMSDGDQTQSESVADYAEFSLRRR
jgi:hypothetical protein